MLSAEFFEGETYDEKVTLRFAPNTRASRGTRIRWRLPRWVKCPALAVPVLPSVCSDAPANLVAAAVGVPSRQLLSLRVTVAIDRRFVRIQTCQINGTEANPGWAGLPPSPITALNLIGSGSNLLPTLKSGVSQDDNIIRTLGIGTQGVLGMGRYTHWVLFVKGPLAVGLVLPPNAKPPKVITLARHIYETLP